MRVGSGVASRISARQRHPGAVSPSGRADAQHILASARARRLHPSAQTDRGSLIDPNKRYELPELIDLAQRVNPETRAAWEAARRAALAVGLVESEYVPVLTISALGGYKSVGVPIRQSNARSRARSRALARTPREVRRARVKS